jgi:hypothetical protein
MRRAIPRAIEQRKEDDDDGETPQAPKQYGSTSPNGSYLLRKSLSRKSMEMLDVLDFVESKKAAEEEEKKEKELERELLTSRRAATSTGQTVEDLNRAVRHEGEDDGVSMTWRTIADS